VKKLLFAALGALLFASGASLPIIGSAYAQGFPPGTVIRRAVGDRVTFTATSAAFDWGFRSDFVEFCINPSPEAGGQDIFMRFGQTLTVDADDASTATQGGVIVATSNAIFTDGAATASLPGSAMVFRAPDETLGDTAEVAACYGPFPWNTSGLVFNVDTAGSASLDVRAYSR